MTTIAWDGKTMAADKGRWYGDIVVPARKIVVIVHRAMRSVVAGTGKSTRIFAGFEWLEKHCDSTETPDLGEDGQILMANSDGLFVFEGKMERTTLNCQFISVGGGAAMAMGALAAGATAVEAIAIVGRYSPSYSSNGVDSIEL